MAQIYSLEQAIGSGSLAGCVCTFGVFDGLHRGHARLIDQACSMARAQGAPAVALTFDRDPDELFSADALRKLMSNDQRLAALAQSGLDAVCFMPFTMEMARLSPFDFLDEALAPAPPAHLLAGANMRFGAKAEGTMSTLNEWAQARGLRVQGHAMPLLEHDGAVVSSTSIRARLASGDIEGANELLGHAYELRGIVAEGRHDGRELGFPTANIHVETSLRALDDGVYAAYAEVDGRVFRAAASMGESPYFAEEGAASCEVHLLDFDQDIYGKPLQVRFYKRLRPLIAFKTLGDLKATVQDNIAWVRDNMPCSEEYVRGGA